MHELTCPGCGSPSQYNIRDYILMCSFCSASFRYSPETGRKDIFNDHYIVPNTMDPVRVKDTVLEWLRRLHHKPAAVEKEYVVLDIRGTSVPFWVVSLEVHTAWKGIVQRNRRGNETKLGAEFLTESGNFRRSYRWAVSARTNICENWGMTRMHEPKEPVNVVWDGFPLDSTFSRGRMSVENEGEKTAYESREYFEFKYANGLPLLGAQISEDEAIRRAKTHVEWYHYNLAQMHADYLLDCRHELDIAGIQLIHLPFWHANYVYRPNNALKHFYKPVERHVTIEGIHGGILKGELGLIHRDKVQVNALITAGISFFFFLLGAVWSPAFFLVALFFGVVSGLSAYIAMIKLEERKRQVRHVTPDSIQARKNAQELYA